MCLTMTLLWCCWEFCRIPGKNTSSIHRILENLHESFPMCKLLQVPTHSPQTACALKSALEVSLWTLPKWPKTGGPPAEPRVWKWVDKVFHFKFHQANLSESDLSWFIIYSYLFMELTSQKVCYLDPCSKSYVPQVLCTEEGRLEPGSVGRFSNCQLPTRQAVGNPASGFGGKAAILTQRNAHQGNS